MFDKDVGLHHDTTAYGCLDQFCYTGITPDGDKSFVRRAPSEGMVTIVFGREPATFR